MHTYIHTLYIHTYMHTRTNCHELERWGIRVGDHILRSSASKLRNKWPKNWRQTQLEFLISRNFFLLCYSSHSNMVEGKVGESERSEWNSDDFEEDDFVDAEDNIRPVEGGEVLEPYVGMEFESEDDAKRFYNDYARRLGFVVRIMQRRVSDIDGRTLARRLGCNKQGFSPNPKGKIGPERMPRPRAREGCRAAILFKLEKSGKWVVTRFVKEHNHPLVVTARENTNLCDKDMKIQELTSELRRQEELCAEYRERLINLLANIENQSEQFSAKVLAVVQSVRKAEAEALSVSSA